MLRQSRDIFAIGENRQAIKQQIYKASETAKKMAKKASRKPYTRFKALAETSRLLLVFLSLPQIALCFSFTSWTQQNSDTVPCIATTIGVPPLDLSVTDHTISNTCNRALDYVYGLDGTVNYIFSTIVTVSDWRNSLAPSFNTGKEAKLSVGMTSLDPAADVAAAAAVASWAVLGTQYHSKVLDLGAAPIWGTYIMLRYECASTPCKQTTIYEVVGLKTPVETGITASSEHTASMSAILPENFNINCSSTYRITTGCSVFSSVLSSNPTLWFDFTSTFGSQKVFVFPAIIQDSAHQIYYEKTAFDKFDLYYSDSISLDNTNYSSQRDLTETVSNSASWIKNKQILMPTPYPVLKSAMLKFTEYSPTNSKLMGVLFLRTSALCGQTSSCGNVECLRFVKGDTSDITMTLGQTITPFSWTVTIPHVCNTAFTYEALTSEDVYNLVTVTSDVTDDTGTMKTLMTISFAISDNDDITKARTGTTNFGFRLKNSSTGATLLEQKRKLIYTNPCDNETFFSSVGNPLVTIALIPSKLSDVTEDMAPLTPDTVSNGQNGADHFTYCAAARTYAITTASPAIATSKYTLTGSSLLLALGAAQTTEQEATATLTVNLEIGGAIVDSITPTVKFAISCANTGAYWFHTGTTSNLVASLNSGLKDFSWDIRFLEPCKSYLTVAIDQSQDVDSLFTITKAAIAVVSPDAIQIVRFSMPTDNIAAKARTLTFVVGTFINHSTAGQQEHYTRTIVYTNPCNVVDFFDETPASSILSYTMILGLDTVVKNNIGSRLQDKLSVGLGTADGYSYCNGARVYSAAAPAGIEFKTFAFKSAPDTAIFVTQLDIAQTVEFQVTFNLQVNLVIGASSDVVDSITRTATIAGITCRARAVVSSYITSYDVYLRQNSWSHAKPVWTWDALCSGTYDEKIEFLKPSDSSVIATFTGGATAAMPAGITLDASFGLTIFTQKAMTTAANYHATYIVKYSITNASAQTPQIAHTISSQITIVYKDECNDTSQSSIQPFVVSAMQTSVLRVISEYPSAVVKLPDVKQEIPDPDAKALFLFNDSSRWNTNICGSMVVELIQDGLTAEFATHSYTFGATQADRWVKLLPDKNAHVGTYTITLRIKFSDIDYPAVYKDVPVAIQILPCEIKSTPATSTHTNPYTYTIVEQTTTMQQFEGKLYTFEPNCNYADQFSWSVSPALTTHQDQFHTVNSSSSLFKIQTLNLHNRGDYVITQTLTKIAYGSAYGISQVVTTLNLKLIDPCKVAVMQPTLTTVDLYAIIGLGTRSTTFEDYQDDISIKFDDAQELTYGRILCGPRNYQLKLAQQKSNGSYAFFPTGAGTQNDFIQLVKTVGQNNIAVTYGSGSVNHAGVQRVEVQAQMQNYTSLVDHSAFYQVTLYHQQTDLTVLDVTYTLTYDAIEVAIPEPVFLPALHTSSNAQTGANGEEIVYSAVVVKNGAEVVLPGDLLVFDENEKKLTIKCKDPIYIGSTRVRVKFKMQDYLDGWELTTEFTVLVKPKPLNNLFSVQPKPYFDLAGLTLVHTVSVGQAWQFSLPQGLHPHEDPSSVSYSSVKLGTASRFVDYDRSNALLSMEAGSTAKGDVGDYPIKLELIDLYGLRSDVMTITLQLTDPESEGSDSANNKTDAVDDSVGLQFAKELEDRAKQKQIDMFLEQKKLVYPTASFDSISQLGIARISFSKPMQVKDSMKTMKQGDKIELRKLAGEEQVPVSDLVEFKVLPGLNSEEETLRFSWKVQSFTKKSLAVKLEFERPLFVSTQQGYRDSLEVTLKSGYLLDEDNLPLEKDATFTKHIPKQFSNASTQQALESTQQFLDSGTQVTLIVNIGLNFLQASSLQYLWDMINAQQIVILTPLFNVSIPQNAMIFFGWLMQIAAMEALPTDWMYSFLSSKEGRPISPIFEEIGFEHHLFMNNSGSMGVFLVCLPFLYLIHYMSTKCESSKCCRRCAKKLGKQIYWSILLRGIIEGFVIGLICCLINMRQLDFTDSEKWTYANAVISLFVLVSLSLFPFISVCFMLRNHNKLEEPEMHQKYGEMTEGYKIQNLGSIYYWILEYVRRAALVVVVVLAPTQLWLQVMILFYLSIAIIISAGYVHARTDLLDQKMDIFNEVKLIFIMYHMITFTDFVPDPETQEQMGYSCSAILVLGTATNMYTLFIRPIRQFKLNCKIRKAKKLEKKTRLLKLHAEGARTSHERRLKRFKLWQKEQRSKMRERELEKRAVQKVKAAERTEQRRLHLVELARQKQELTMQRHFSNLAYSHKYNRLRRRQRMLSQMQESALERIVEDEMSSDSEDEQNGDVQMVQSRIVRRVDELVDLDKIASDLLSYESQIQHTFKGRAAMGGTTDQQATTISDFSLKLDETSPYLRQRDDSQDTIQSQPEQTADQMSRQKRLEAVLDMNAKVDSASSGKPELIAQQPPHKLTWSDLDYMWQHHGISVSQIQTIPGYENFELADDEPEEDEPSLDQRSDAEFDYENQLVISDDDEQQQQQQDDQLLSDYDNREEAKIDLNNLYEVSRELDKSSNSSLDISDDDLDGTDVYTGTHLGAYNDQNISYFSRDSFARSHKIESSTSKLQDMQGHSFAHLSGGDFKLGQQRSDDKKIAPVSALKDTSDDENNGDYDEDLMAYSKVNRRRNISTFLQAVDEDELRDPSQCMPDLKTLKQHKDMC